MGQTVKQLLYLPSLRCFEEEGGGRRELGVGGKRVGGWGGGEMGGRRELGVRGWGRRNSKTWSLLTQHSIPTQHTATRKLKQQHSSRSTLLPLSTPCFWKLPYTLTLSDQKRRGEFTSSEN
uniref:Uncharacterized protein n=1 Tax=Desertifilum tharense IPPAS B-1220 TaxID=1781255 RepID=A0ACD5GZU3_9CYAN